MIKNVLFKEEEIKEKIRELGTVISKDYENEGKNLLVISLLRGSFIFTADLVRHITIPVRIEFIETASYGFEKTSTGEVKIFSNLTEDISEYDVLIVDDILDSGNTMKAVYDVLREKHPKSLKTCTLLDKPSRRQADIDVDYKGFVIEDLFVAGYGLNFGHHYRNTPYIFEVIDN
ncbi:hypoxanthine phosphoribosyltransferase [Ornithinibacillus bavariensis]|uniref:Hypoxanthine phosphoribosyltransferase n=1 Tax=Ornithinibacillus bavariensis TaxID=545502 RepID=A0A920C628_9BACI|nr:hypoxanthine phosphoribosyltransferase [Ornithinibacillus bavariensis]GIO27355.1 hypoxanthine phosphoribosyltransferase [Ornithinibacillus bavariensis]